MCVCVCARTQVYTITHKRMTRLTYLCIMNKFRSSRSVVIFILNFTRSVNIEINLETVFSHMHTITLVRDACPFTHLRHLFLLDKLHTGRQILLLVYSSCNIVCEIFTLLFEEIK